MELQKAIANNEEFKLINSIGELNDKDFKKYLKFIPHYLYYFDFRFDQREVAHKKMKKYDDTASLINIPIGAKEPSVFQRKTTIKKYILYTHSLGEFYAAPK